MKTTIKIQTTETKEIEKEITLPYYSNESSWFFKINEDKSVVRASLSHDEQCAWLSVVDTGSSFNEAVQAKIGRAHV